MNMWREKIFGAEFACSSFKDVTTPWGWHVFNHDVPFGGIGNSGMGTYHADEGFRELSHAKSVFKRNRYFPMELFSRRTGASCSAGS